TMLMPAGAAAASESGEGLTIETHSPHDGEELVAGKTYTFTYSLINDTGAAIKVDPGAFVTIMYAYDKRANVPKVESCVGYRNAGTTDLDRRIGYWELQLPTTIPGGYANTCTITYKPTSQDIAQGGLWTM